MLMTFILYYYDIPPYEPPLQSNADNTNMAYQAPGKKSLLRVAKLLNLTPRSLADEAKSVIWSNAICIE